MNLHRFCRHTSIVAPIALWLALGSVPVAGQNKPVAPAMDKRLLTIIQGHGRIAVIGADCGEHPIAESLRALKEALEKWGRVQVVQSESDADLVLLLQECLFDVANDAPDRYRAMKRTLMLYSKDLKKARPWISGTEIFPWNRPSDILEPLRSAVEKAELPPAKH